MISDMWVLVVFTFIALFFIVGLAGVINPFVGLIVGLGCGWAYAFVFALNPFIWMGSFALIGVFARLIIKIFPDVCQSTLEFMMFDFWGNDGIFDNVDIDLSDFDLFD